MKVIALGFVLVAASSAAVGQPSAGPGRPNPADALAPVPPVAHQSPFAQYRPFAAEVLGPWKAANDEVGRIGGWKAYAREVYEETTRASPSNEKAGKPPATPADAGTQRVK